MSFECRYKSLQNKVRVSRSTETLKKFGLFTITWISWIQSRNRRRRRIPAEISGGGRRHVVAVVAQGGLAGLQRQRIELGRTTEGTTWGGGAHTENGVAVLTVAVHVTCCFVQFCVKRRVCVSSETVFIINSKLTHLCPNSVTAMALVNT